MSTMTLPSVDQSVKQQPRRAQKQREIDEPQEGTPGYSASLAAFRRIDLRLPIRHRAIMRDKLRQLQDSGAKLADGTEVTDKTKAVLWILENL